MPIDQNLLQAGIERHRAGDLAAARAIYDQLLAASPREALVLNLLGAACLDAGQLEDAGRYLVEAVRADPGCAAAFDNLGLMFSKQNRPKEAVVSFRRAVALDPKSAQTQQNLAAVLLRCGQFAEAVEALRQVVLLLPGNVRAQFELATALVHAGQRPEAIEAYQAVTRMEPVLPEAYVNLAKLTFEEKAYDDSVRWARAAIELRPQSAEGFHNLGCALTKLRQFDEGIKALQTAVRLKPQMTEAYRNLGVALLDAEQFDAAIAHHRHSLANNPDDAEELHNLGTVYMKRGDLDAAISHFSQALALQPDHAEAHHNRAGAWLLQGKFAEGFPEYEWRFRLKARAPFDWPWKIWHGEPLAGRTIVLCAEGGWGDTFQFIRYAPLVKAQGARVVVLCPRAQQPILSRTEGVDEWISLENDAPFAADFCLPMMSLPHRLHTTLETIPAAIPYVFADPQLLSAWQQRLASCEQLKVGINWQGNPLFPADRQRSIALAHFAPLARVRGVQLFNLQQGPGLEQLSAVRESWPVIEFGRDVDTSAGAFTDTAAIMKNLDVVISSDTAAAHLAGALGANTWVALQRVPECRWLVEREDCPWYPTMRLFRQTRHGDWPDVFARIAGELERLVAARGGQRQ